MPLIPSGITVSATPYDNSGILVASGDVSATYPGPWRIETQTMRIDYERVPYGYWNGMVGNVGALSGGVTASGPILGTTLAYRVTAEHKVVKSYDIFDTSTYVQNQRFKVVANPEDAYGNSYGDLSAGTNVNGATGSQFALGPQGAIITEEPYYNRRPWNDDIDVTSVNSFNGCNVRYASTYSTGTSSFEPFSYYEGGFFNNHYLNSRFRLSFLECGYGDAEYAPVPRYWMGGGYTTTSESDTLIIDFVDEVGTNLATANVPDKTQPNTPQTLSQFYVLNPAFGIDATFGNQTEYSPTMYRTAMTQYDILRHDFS